MGGIKRAVAMDTKTAQNIRITKNTIVSPKQQPSSKTGFYACNHKNRDEIAKHVAAYEGEIDIIPNNPQGSAKAQMGFSTSQGV